MTSGAVENQAADASKRLCGRQARNGTPGAHDGVHEDVGLHRVTKPADTLKREESVQDLSDEEDPEDERGLACGHIDPEGKMSADLSARIHSRRVSQRSQFHRKGRQTASRSGIRRLTRLNNVPRPRDYQSARWCPFLRHCRVIGGAFVSSCDIRWQTVVCGIVVALSGLNAVLW